MAAQSPSSSTSSAPPSSASTSPTSPQPPEAQLAVGDRVYGGRFVVRKKLGEGSCGSVWSVEMVANGLKYAMKCEPFQKCKDDEILRMELYSLKKLQASKHIPRFIASGCHKNFSFIVMTLLGKDLEDCRRKCNGRKVTQHTTLRLALQGVQALEDMHRHGFIHRDVKPCNFALGIQNNRTLYIFDFGLCRQIMLPDASGKLVLREPRAKVSFRGTVRYCSLNVHAAKELGRHDDLYGLLYSMIETTTGTLPWKGLVRAESAKCKERTTDAELYKNCPRGFAEFGAALKRLGYADTPPYELIRANLSKNILELGIKMTDEFDWEKLCKAEKRANKHEKDADASTQGKPEKDKDDDNDTTKDLAASVMSQMTECPPGEDGAVENTLDQAPGDIHSEEGHAVKDDPE
ncbi:unnamed protein product, partial [Mesorhabditis spiculigera]